MTLLRRAMTPSRWWSAWKRENGLRRDFEMKHAVGLPEQIYTRGTPELPPLPQRASLLAVFSYRNTVARISLIGIISAGIRVGWRRVM